MNGKTNPVNIIKAIESHRSEMKSMGVERIGLFGSYLSGRPRSGSDMDFIVSFRSPTFDNYMELKFLLERIFRKKIDLVTEDALKPAMRGVRKEALYAKGM